MYPYFDAHCDTLWRCGRERWALERNPGHLDLERLAAYGPMGQVFARYEDSVACPDGFAAIRAQWEQLQKARETHPDLLSRCCLSVEGAELLDCDIEKLDLVKSWGVRWINLTWNHENALAGPHTRGRDFVRAMGERGLFVDVSHLSDRGFWDVLDTVRGPVLASHSNSRTLCPHSRNLTDEMAREIFARRGFVGVNFCVHFLGENPAIETVIAHIEHFLDLGGVDCLGLGSDFDGTDLPPDLAGVQAMPRLWEALERRGYPRSLIEKLAYANLARFLGDMSAPDIGTDSCIAMTIYKLK